MIPTIMTSFLYTTCVMGSEQEANWNMVFFFNSHDNVSCAIVFQTSLEAKCEKLIPSILMEDPCANSLYISVVITQGDFYLSKENLTAKE